jgi:hypothetical protein
MVSLLELCWRNISAGGMEPALVPPGNPDGSGEFDFVGCPPGAVASDQLGLVEAVDRLGQGVVVAVTFGADPVVVAISYDLMPDVLEYAQRVSAIGSCVAVTLPGGPNARAILSPEHAIGVAVALRDQVRKIARSHRSADLHLFLAVPGGLALLLGHLWDHMPATQLYEDLAGGRYEPAFLIRQTAIRP